MKTVASVLTLCGQRTWGTARQAFFKKQNKKNKKTKPKKKNTHKTYLSKKKKDASSFFFFFFVLRLGEKKAGLEVRGVQSEGIVYSQSPLAVEK